jgi:hypothetical protein
MKLIVAIVRPEKLNDVLETLFQEKLRRLTITQARGHGGELESVETYRGTTVKMELVDKVRLHRHSDPLPELSNMTREFRCSCQSPAREAAPRTMDLFVGSPSRHG